MKSSLKSKATQLPLLQSTRSHILIRGLGEGVEEIGLLAKMDVERTEERGGKAEEVTESTGVEKGKIKSSELEISNKNDDNNIDEDSDCTRVGAMKEEGKIINTSQNSPVHPAKH